MLKLRTLSWISISILFTLLFSCSGSKPVDPLFIGQGPDPLVPDEIHPGKVVGTMKVYGPMPGATRDANRWNRNPQHELGVYKRGIHTRDGLVARAKPTMAVPIPGVIQDPVELIYQIDNVPPGEYDLGLFHYDWHDWGVDFFRTLWIGDSFAIEPNNNLPIQLDVKVNLLGEGPYGSVSGRLLISGAIDETRPIDIEIGRSDIDSQQGLDLKLNSGSWSFYPDKWKRFNYRLLSIPVGEYLVAGGSAWYQRVQLTGNPVTVVEDYDEELGDRYYQPKVLPNYGWTGEDRRIVVSIEVAGAWDESNSFYSEGADLIFLLSEMNPVDGQPSRAIVHIDPSEIGGLGWSAEINLGNHRSGSYELSLVSVGDDPDDVRVIREFDQHFNVTTPGDEHNNRELDLGRFVIDLDRMVYQYVDSYHSSKYRF